MANIKCKYYRHRCGYGEYGWAGRICSHISWDVSFYDCYAHDGCIHGDSGDFDMDVCKHAYRETVIFEKNIKSYELDDDGLSFRRQFIPYHRINYLFIDGKEVISEDD